MAEIRIDDSALSGNIQTLSGQIDELEQLNSQLYALLNQIAESWEGEACVQYIASMTTRREKAEQMVEVLNEFKKYMEEALEQFQEEDQSSASKIVLL